MDEGYEIDMVHWPTVKWETNAGNPEKFGRGQVEPTNNRFTGTNCWDYPKITPTPPGQADLDARIKIAQWIVRKQSSSDRSRSPSHSSRQSRSKSPKQNNRKERRNSRSRSPNHKR